MRRQRGAALLVILLIVGALGAYFAISALNSQSERDRISAQAMAQAKEALIGNAAAERHNGLFGFLSAPDLGSTRNGTAAEGNAAGNFAENARNRSIVGRLPWRTLGLPPLRDAAGECLWYAVSGSGQNLLAPHVFNWDSLGHFELFRSDGTPAGTTSISGNNFHDRPIALVISAGPALAGQVRNRVGADNVTECSGNYNTRNYLDTLNANPGINNILNYFGGSLNSSTGDAYGLSAAINASQLSPAQLAAPKAIMAGKVEAPASNVIVNDKVLPITTREVFDRVKRRSDFMEDINGMINELANCLNALPSSLPATSILNKGIDGVIAACGTAVPYPLMLTNWRDNLLYARFPSAATVNGAPGCEAVLIFGGERTTRTMAPLVAQTRVSAAERGTVAGMAFIPMYLENTNATLFPNVGDYLGPSEFDGAAASTDVVRCIKAPGATQKSFAANFNEFVAAGSGVTTNAADKTVAVATSPGNGGGCFWYPQAVPLAGKVLRAFYDFKFMQPDGFALTGSGTDMGYGFTLQMVNNELGIPPSHCGLKTEMGALNGADSWGYFSYIFETDVRRNATHADPVENHTAIMVNGNLDHSLSGTLSTACNGSATGCRYTPANKFEEAPPQLHKQRIEIHTGCTPGCGTCNPASHVAPNTYARIAVWSDCSQCSDVVTDLDRLAKPPTAERCIALDPKLNTFYFGFTGGFLGSQGVTLRNLILRTE